MIGLICVQNIHHWCFYSYKTCPRYMKGLPLIKFAYWCRSVLPQHQWVSEVNIHPVFSLLFFILKLLYIYIVTTFTQYLQKKSTDCYWSWWCRKRTCIMALLRTTRIKELAVQYILHRDKRWDTQYDVTLSFRYKGLLLPYNRHPYLPQYVISSLLLHNYMGWDCGMHYHIETKTKLPPFRTRHIQMHFLK